MSKRTFQQAFNAVFHKDYEFSDFCELDISNEIEEFEIGGRKIIRTSEKLKKMLRFLDKVIFRNLAKDEDVVHSFVKGKSTLSAVMPHVNSRYFFLTDIRNFYPSIKSEDVRRILERDKDLLPASDFEDYIELVVNMTTVGGAIPVGFPTSPQLSNAFLLEFDRAVKDYCASCSILYSRYADDIIISGEKFEQLENLKEKIQFLLDKHASSELILKDSKTRITQIGNKVKILGLVVLPNGRITVDSKYKDKIETLIYFYLNDKDKYQDYLETEFSGSEHSLFGLLHYAKSVDPKYLEKLQRKYGVYSLKTLMEDKWSEQR